MAKSAKAKRDQKKGAAANRQAVNAAKQTMSAKNCATAAAAAPNCGLVDLAQNGSGGGEQQRTVAPAANDAHFAPDDATEDGEVEYVEEPGLGEAGEQFDSLVNDRFVAPQLAIGQAMKDRADALTLAAQSPDSMTGGEAGLVEGARPHKKQRLPLDDLKLKAPRPDLVEYHDCNSPEPYLLVLLKSQRNTMPVPRHWAQKSIFLSSQINRDVTDEVVPAFIENTGVAAMRSDKAKLDGLALAKPFLAGHPHLPLTQFGDIFFEGKDLRSRFRRFKPGVLSDRLRQALGMTTNSPPPFLYGMQIVRRLPLAYPEIKIPGMNAPLPPGARWGKSRGEWGQPVRNPDNSLKWPEVMNSTQEAEESWKQGTTTLGFRDYAQASTSFSSTMTLWGTSDPSGSGAVGLPTLAFKLDEEAQKRAEHDAAEATERAKEERERKAEAERAAADAAARASIPGFAPSVGAISVGQVPGAGAAYKQQQFAMEMQRVAAQGYGSGMLAVQGAYVNPGFDTAPPLPGQVLPGAVPPTVAPGKLPPRPYGTTGYGYSDGSYR